MATNETLRVRLARAQAEAVRSGRLVLGTGFVARAAQSASFFLLSAVLAGGKLFGYCAPFALALVGGAGSGLNAAAALGGACFGYLTLLGLVDGLRYVSDPRPPTLRHTVRNAFLRRGLKSCRHITRFVIL